VKAENNRPTSIQRPSFEYYCYKIVFISILLLLFVVSFCAESMCQTILHSRSHYLLPFNLSLFSLIAFLYGIYPVYSYFVARSEIFIVHVYHDLISNFRNRETIWSHNIRHTIFLPFCIIHSYRKVLSYELAQQNTLHNHKSLKI
jgi:TRAP-type mannitol/chloroaromatic compound transport system permease small subunit